MSGERQRKGAERARVRWRTTVWRGVDSLSAVVAYHITNFACKCIYYAILLYKTTWLYDRQAEPVLVIGTQMQDILATEISLVPISFFIVQENATSLTITGSDFEDNLSAWTDDHLCRPDLYEQIVLLLRLEVGDILGFVVATRQPFPVTRVGFVDRTQGSAKPAFNKINLRSIGHKITHLLPEERGLPRYQCRRSPCLRHPNVEA